MTTSTLALARKSFPAHTARVNIRADDNAPTAYIEFLSISITHSRTVWRKFSTAPPPPPSYTAAKKVRTSLKERNLHNLSLSQYWGERIKNRRNRVHCSARLRSIGCSVRAHGRVFSLRHYRALEKRVKPGSGSGGGGVRALATDLSFSLSLPIYLSTYLSLSFSLRG